jgi:hypothetical protein
VTYHVSLDVFHFCVTYLTIHRHWTTLICKSGFLDFVHRIYFNKITTFRKLDLLPSSGKKGRTKTQKMYLDAHLNTSVRNIPQTMVVARCLLLRAHLGWSCPGLRLAQPGGPTARVSVFPFFLPEDGRRSSFRNVILLKYRRWTKSKEPLLQIKRTIVRIL